MFQLDSLLAETMKVIEKSKDLVNIFGVFSLQELDLPLLVHYSVNVDNSMKNEVVSIRQYKYVTIFCNPVSKLYFSCLINRGEMVRVRLLCNKRAISCSLNAIQIRASLPLLLSNLGLEESPKSPLGSVALWRTQRRK